MMIRYSLAFFADNKIKAILSCLSLAVYFGLVVIAVSLQESIPEIARLPLQHIGVQTIVQKTGEIPGQMVGAIFPHSNAPIDQAEFERLKKLPFVKEADQSLYFWYFDTLYFKALLGVRPEGGILADILEKNIGQGQFSLDPGQIIITSSLSSKNGLKIGDFVSLGEDRFRVTAILKPNVTGNVVPADIYMDRNDALRVVRKSEEMQKIYQFGDGQFGNVVLLRSNPDWQGDKELLVKALDEKLLVFSEKTFTREITDQLGIVSMAGQWLFVVLGVVLAMAFGLLTSFNLKSREGEIAILRMIGWRLLDLKKQFIGENFIILAVAMITGSCLSLAGLFWLSRVPLSMELPWDISARPHFLPAENSIERIVSAPLPVHLAPEIYLVSAGGFLLLFLAVSLFSFRRLKRVKPYEDKSG